MVIFKSNQKKFECDLIELCGKRLYPTESLYKIKNCTRTRNFHTSPLFKENSILKFQDKIFLEIFYLSANL